MFVHIICRKNKQELPKSSDKKNRNSFGTFETSSRAAVVNINVKDNKWVKSICTLPNTKQGTNETMCSKMGLSWQRAPNPLKNWDPVNPPFEFWKFGRRLNPSPQQNKGEGAAHYEFTEVWHVMWFFAGTLIWSQTHTHTQRHKHKDSQNPQGPVDWHTHTNYNYTNCYVFIAAHVCSYYRHYIQRIIHWYQKFTFHNVFSFQK